MNTRKSLRRQAAAIRRRRSWSHSQREWSSYQPHGVALKFKHMRAWQGTDQWRSVTAVYVKTSSGWKLHACDRELEFLRYCGKKEDAQRALEKRRFSWEWMD